MKRFIIFIGIVAFSGYKLYSNTVSSDSLFNLANNQYKQREYFEAIDNYQAIAENGVKSAAVFYNLGNAYFKTGNFSKAILNYERAKLLDPSDEDVEFNLQKSRTHIIDKIEAIPELFFTSWVNRLLSFLSSNSWAILSLIVFLVALSILLLYFLITSSHIKRMSFFLGVILILVSLFSYLAAKRTKNLVEKSNSGIVMEQIVRVKSSPDNESSDMFVIHEGTKIFILREVDHWSEIRLADGKQGWMETEDFEKI
jgi:tetratricopeptide (TPR) repeat protein